MKKTPLVFFCSIILLASSIARSQQPSVFLERLRTTAQEQPAFHVPTKLLPTFNPEYLDSTLGTRILAAMNATFSATKPFNQHGVAVSVIVPGGWPEWSGGVGTNDDVYPMDSTKIFEVASNTKTFVTALIMRLQDSGKLSISDSIYKWLVKKYPNVDSAITIKMLLNHSSGIYDFLNDDTTGSLLLDAYLNNPTKHWTPDSILMHHVGKPNFKPGTSYKYSNTNFMLLGLIAERAGNRSLRDQMHQYLFGPLHLTHTYFGGEDTIKELFSDNYSAADASNPAIDYASIDKTAQLTMAWGVGNICSTVGDLARWSHALYGGKVVSPASVKLMTTMNHWPDGSYYGLGTAYAPYGSRAFFGHNGSLPGFKSAEYTNLIDSVSISAFVNWDPNPNITDKYLNDYLIDILNEVYKAAPNAVHSSDEPSIKISVFPNPATDHITFDYYLSSDGHSRLTIFNMLGERMETIVDKNESSGIHTAYFDASHLTRGTYMYVLQTGDGVMSGKVSVQ